MYDILTRNQPPTTTLEFYQMQVALCLLIVMWVAALSMTLWCSCRYEGAPPYKRAKRNNGISIERALASSAFTLTDTLMTRLQACVCTAMTSSW